ncbi:MAG: phage terminase large subunit, partial [Patescibacteria group bacterium]
STRVIWPEWIQYYDKLPDKNARPRHVVVGVDLAISQRETADYTSMVTIKVYGYGKNLKVFVLPNPINKRMGFVETINTIEGLDAALRADGNYPKMLIETNGFQENYFEKLKCDGIWSIEGIKQTSDKRSRLALTSYYIQNGTIIFPRAGAEELISQLIGFGIENHNDLCDAFSMVAIKLIEMTKYDNANHKVVWI